MRRSLAVALAMAAACAPAAAAPPPSDALGIRVSVMALANEGMRIRAAQAMYARRHGADATTVAELAAEGGLRTAPRGSAIVRDAGGTPAAWRLPGSRGGIAEIAIAADALDGPVCREAARLAAGGEPFGCAAAADGIVFRYGPKEP